MGKIKSKKLQDQVSPEEAPAKASVDPIQASSKTEKVQPNTEAHQSNKEDRSKQSTSVRIRKGMINDLKDSCNILCSVGLDNLATEITNLTKRASRDRFTVCFAGEFSHGKSTLINKVLGKQVLPTDDLPTTAFLTTVTYSRQNLIEEVDSHGKTLQKLPLNEQSWEGLTAFDENGVANDTDERNVIRVGVDNDWLRKSGITILDTPGANDGSKSRDMEISRALLLADGVVICVDALQGIKMSQEAFIKDRIIKPRLPYVALAITRLDLIAKENRDRVVTNIMAKLKLMKVEMPVIISNEVEMPSDFFKANLGIEKLRSLMVQWSRNPDRSRLIEAWLAAGVQNLLSIGVEALEEKKKLLAVRGEERERLIIEKKKEITERHEEWEQIRKEIDAMEQSCQKEFRQKLHQQRSKMIADIKYRIDTVPDPAKWYEQSYQYEVSNRLTAAIISLDRMVTETARNDFERINKDLMMRYKSYLDRDGKTWNSSSDSSEYVHSQAPQLADIRKMQDNSNLLISAATVVGGIVATSLFMIGGIVGTIGASTAARTLSKKRIEKEINKARMQLAEFVESDIESVFADATRDCEARIKLVYGDIIRGTKFTESNWMKTQYDLIEQAAQPAEESVANTVETINHKITLLNDICSKFDKYLS